MCAHHHGNAAQVATSEDTQRLRRTLKLVGTAEMIGTAVFSGMIGVTFFGLLFTPVFYVVIRRRKAKAAESHLSPAAPETIQPEP